MSDEQLPTDEHPGMNPTNAKLAVLMGGHTRKILQGLARLEKLIADPGPTASGIAEQIENALRDDAAADEPKFNSFSRFFLDQIVIEARCPRSPIERWAPAESDPELEAAERYAEIKALRSALNKAKEGLEVARESLGIDGEGRSVTWMDEYFAALDAVEVRRPRRAAPFESADPEADLEAEEPAGPVVDYIPVSWEEYGERIKTMLAKSVKKGREMTEAIDAVMAAGLMAVSEKGNVALALGELIATMIPEGGPMHEIPEGWAPVVLAINPMTGDFLTIAGPRSEPDGRVEALETMLARQLKSAVGNTLRAVREAGRPQPKMGNGAALGLEGSCPICRLGEVGPLGDDFECAKCGRLFCGKCGGVKGAPHENVAACSCEGRTL